MVDHAKQRLPSTLFGEMSKDLQYLRCENAPKEADKVEIEGRFRSAVDAFDARSNDFSQIENWYKACESILRVCPRSNNRCLTSSVRWLALNNLNEKMLEPREVELLWGAFRPERRFQLYGLPLTEIFARGGQFSARMVIELTTDGAVESFIEDFPAEIQADVVVDPFAGTGNSLYQITRKMKAKGFGLEYSAQVQKSAAKMLAFLDGGDRVDLRHGTFPQDLSIDIIGDSRNVIMYVAPSWFGALIQGKLDITLSNIPRTINIMFQKIQQRNPHIEETKYHFLVPVMPENVPESVEALKNMVQERGGKYHGIIGRRFSRLLLFTLTEQQILRCPVKSGVCDANP